MLKNIYTVCKILNLYLVDLCTIKVSHDLDTHIKITRKYLYNHLTIRNSNHLYNYNANVMCT